MKFFILISALVAVTASLTLVERSEVELEGLFDDIKEIYNKLKDLGKILKPNYFIHFLDGQ